MKKIVGILLLIIMMIVLTACGSTTPNVDTDTLPPNLEINESKILIAYFTWAENTVVANPDSVDVDASTSASLVVGNTALMAGYIQKITGGDLFSIEVKNPYPSDYNECLNRANREKSENARPELKNSVEKMDDYDIVFLGYPNWWYTIPMAVHTFLDSYDFGGKTVIPFCAHGTGGLASSVRDIRSAIPSATVLNAIGIYRNDMGDAESRIYEWLSTLGFNGGEN